MLCGRVAARGLIKALPRQGLAQAARAAAAATAACPPAGARPARERRARAPAGAADSHVAGGALGGTTAASGHGAAVLAIAAAAATALASGRDTDCCLKCEEMRRVVVARDADIADGELKQVKVPKLPGKAAEGQVLLARIDGKLYATGASCSHYSAPLAQGVAAKDKMHVVCPWHDAAFDLRTGMPVRGAGLQAIPTYSVSVEDGDIVVEVPLVMDDFVAPKMVKRCPNDQRVFLIVGGGAAGVAAADALRQEGYTGRIVLLTEEQHLPYDRPVLSKNLVKAAEPESLALRERAYFEEHDIEVRCVAKVAKLRAKDRVACLADGEEIRYDSALVATGARPRELPIPGSRLPGVLTLRNPEDAQRIAAACPKGAHAVVIGSSFIGMEVAASLKRRGCEVTVLGMEDVPFQRVLGRQVGEALQHFFESKGVKFIGKAVASEIKRTETGMTTVLQSGDALKCDAVVVGVGVVPNADFVEGAERAPDGSLLTDARLRTSAEGLFAAGDVATYRSPVSGDRLRVEHWDVATSQGRTAAKGMAGRGEDYDPTPFFWTSLFGKNLRYVGHCAEFDEVFFEGDVQKLSFVAFYCLKGQVKAVATMGRDPVAVVVGELMRMGKMCSLADLKGGKASSSSLADELKRLSRAA